MIVEVWGRLKRITKFWIFVLKLAGFSTYNYKENLQFSAIISSAGIYYEKEWAEDKEIMKKTMPSASDNLDSIRTAESTHTEL